MKKPGCLRCGRCCEDVQIAYSPEELKKAFSNWVESSGSYPKEIYLLYPMFVYKRFNGKTRRWHYKCKHFVKLGGKPTCTIHKFRPKMCKNFPNYNHGLRMDLKSFNPSQYKGCGYNEDKKFDWTKSF